MGGARREALTRGALPAPRHCGRRGALPSIQAAARDEALSAAHDGARRGATSGVRRVRKCVALDCLARDCAQTRACARSRCCAQGDSRAKPGCICAASAPAAASAASAAAATAAARLHSAPYFGLLNPPDGAAHGPGPCALSQGPGRFVLAHGPGPCALALARPMTLQPDSRLPTPIQLATFPTTNLAQREARLLPAAAALALHACTRRV